MATESIRNELTWKRKKNMEIWYKRTNDLSFYSNQSLEINLSSFTAANTSQFDNCQ